MFGADDNDVVLDGAGALWPSFERLLRKAGADVIEGVIAPGLILADQPLLHSPPWTQGEHPEFASLDIFSAIAAFPKTILLGPPGSGKSTVARCIAMCHAAKAADLGLAMGPKDLGLWPEEPLTPLYVELRDLFSSDYIPHADRSSSKIDAGHFVRYLTEKMLEGDGDLSDVIQADMREGRAILIFDGLDEASTLAGTFGTTELRIQQMKSMMQSISNRFPKIKILVTSRPAAYSDWSLPGFESVRLLPLNDVERAEIVEKTLFYLGHTTDQLKELAAQLLSQFGKVPREILHQPLFVSLLAALFSKNNLEIPPSKAELIESSIRLLIGNWSETRLGGRTTEDLFHYSEDEIYSKLASVAFRAHSESSTYEDEGSDIAFGVVLEEFYDSERSVPQNEIMKFLMTQSGILLSPAQNRVRFSHRLFQEYLAARHVFDLPDGAKRVAELFFRYPDVWSEPVLFFYNVCSNSARQDRQFDLLQYLLNQGFDDKEGTIVHGQSIRILCRCIVQDATIDHVTGALRHMIVSLGKAIERIAVERHPLLEAEDYALLGEALARIGDNRRGVGVRAGVPDITWVAVDGGEKWIGSDKDWLNHKLESLEGEHSARDWKFDLEYPKHSVFLEPYEIAKYPITNAQFLCFVESEEGYHVDDWWTDDGLIWRNGNGPIINSERAEAALPKTNVSWYEAFAFCRWLGHLTSHDVRLPSEAEWEASNMKPATSLFPLGLDAGESLYNTLEAGLNRTLPVGVFPNECSKDMPLDLVGNVWEWCNSAVENEAGDVFDYPYSLSDGRESSDLGPSWMRAVRGGYYGNSLLLSRASYRGRDFPSLRFARQGFRIARFIKRSI